MSPKLTGASYAEHMPLLMRMQLRKPRYSKVVRHRQATAAKIARKVATARDGPLPAGTTTNKTPAKTDIRHDLPAAMSSEAGEESIDLFQEPADFYEPEKEASFASHKLLSGKELTVRLVGHNPLWVSCFSSIVASSRAFSFVTDTFIAFLFRPRKLLEICYFTRIMLGMPYQDTEDVTKLGYSSSPIAKKAIVSFLHAQSFHFKPPARALLPGQEQPPSPFPLFPSSMLETL
jgi:hypothetical protein